MRFQSLIAAVAAFTGVVNAVDNSWEPSTPSELDRYFPPACGVSCGPIVIREKNCHNSPTGLQKCMCSWDGAKKHIPLCTACIKNVSPGNANLQPLNKYINECNLKTTTVDPNSAARTAAPMAAAAIAGLAGYYAL